jgi:hypothetical protein
MMLHFFDKPRYYAHSILFCVIPTVFLYANNIDEVNATTIFRPLLVSVSVITLILAGLRVFKKNFSRLTIFITMSVILIFSYRPLAESTDDFLVANNLPGRNGEAALALIILVWCCLSYVILTRKLPNVVHDFLNIMGVTILMISLSTIGFESLQRPASDSQSAVDTQLPFGPLKPTDGDTYPDIIYIVPDRYPNNYVARKFFSFDNEKFIHELRERGFFVAEKSHANYLKTGLSLAATLNLQYLTRLSDIYGEDTGRWQPVFDLVRDHLVQRILRERGYRFIHMGSWWPATKFNKNADENFRGRHEWLTRFETVLLENTPVLDVWKALQGWGKSEPWGDTHGCWSVRNKIEYLKHVGGKKEPVFVFAHFLVPHPPIKFDAEGNCIKGPKEKRKEEREQYKKGFVGQMKYINSAIIDVFDEQIKNNKNKLVFVVQSDEGPFPLSLHLDTNLNWEAAPIDDIRMKFGILNALYFYNKDYNGLSEYSSPVNNFRVILNNTLGAHLPLLEDKAYIFKDMSHIYKFTDVTDTVRSLTDN